MLLLLPLALAYQSSLYGGPGQDTVVADVVNTLRVIGNVEKPTNIKDISEAGWATEKITDYPYHGHKVTLTQAIEDETKAMYNYYRNNCQVTQDTLYRHPAGNLQFGGSDDAVDSAQRVKATLVIDTSFNERQATGLYAPPGELITIEIPEAAKGKLSATFNIHCLDFSTRIGDEYVGSLRNRLSVLQVKVSLTQTVNTIGWPVGGILTIETSIDSCPYPVELNISGCILTPWFRYGVTTDEEWEEIRQYPGLIAVMETGNVMMHIPSHQVRSTTQMNDGMLLLRTCGAVMDRTAMKQRNYGNNMRASGRKKFPNGWWCDNFVPYGAACAYRGYDYSCLPVGWGTGFFNMESVVTSGGWGSLHEMAHHYQHQWGFGDSTEVTNNAIVVMCYSYATEISGYRSEGANGAISYNPSNDKSEYLHMYASITSSSEKPLQMYVMIMYCFGREKQMELIWAHQQNTYYSKDTYGWKGAWLLTAARIFGLDMRKHIQYAGYSIEGNTDLKESAITLLDEMNLKPFCPVANIYQTGYVVNGTVQETVRPYKIVAGIKHVFNFTQYTRWRTDHGTFEIGEIEGRDGAWTKLETGVYEYMPTSTNRGQPDEWRLPYYETTTGQTIITYGKIQQILNRNTFERYENMDKTLTVIEAYNRTVGATPDVTNRGEGGNIATVRGVGAYVVVCKGKFLPPSTGNYTFYAVPDEYALFYISDKPLSYDPDIDADYLVLVDDGGYHSGYDKTKGSSECFLDANSEYYFCFVIYNTDGAGGGKIGYMVNNSGTISDIKSENVIFSNATAEEYRQTNWIPEWVEIKGIDDYGKSLTEPEIVGVTAPTEQMSRPITNLIDGKTDDIYVSKFNPESSAEPFPHTYTLNFSSKSPIDKVTLTNCSPTRGRDVNTDNLSILCDGVLIGSWSYDSTTNSSFTFPEVVHCQSVSIVIENNTETWDGIHGGTCFREISVGASLTASKVIPISNQYFQFSGDWHTELLGGYYNGVGKYISKGGSLEFQFTAPQSEFVIIGDKWLNPDFSDLATVYVNGKQVGQFSPDMSTAPTYGSKMYKTPLFIVRNTDMSSNTRVRIEVASGEIGLAGVLMMQSEDGGLEVPGTSDSSSGLSAGAKAGIGIAVVILVAGIVVGGVFLGMHIKRHKTPDEDLAV